MSAFFLPRDFEVFDLAYAKTKDERIIQARKEVVEYRFKRLHEGDLTGEGLAKFFCQERTIPSLTAATFNECLVSAPNCQW